MVLSIHQKRPGEKIGRYKIEKIIGEGSYGRVFQVLDVTNGQRYALKIETKNRSLLPWEHTVSQDIHRKAPGGFAPEVLQTKLIDFESGIQGLRMCLKGMTIRSVQKTLGG